MKQEWKEFLINAGAEFDEECVATFGNPERERRIAHTGELFCDLSHFGIIAAYGEDVVEFLQAQFTNDINQVDETHSQLSALCSPKGRMLCNFRIFRRENTYYLVLPYELTVKPAQLNVISIEPIWASMSEVARRIEARESLGRDTTELRVEYWRKTATPFACLILPLLTIPFAVRTTHRRGL